MILIDLFASIFESIHQQISQFKRIDLCKTNRSFSKNRSLYNKSFFFFRINLPQVLVILICFTFSIFFSRGQTRFTLIVIKVIGLYLGLGSQSSTCPKKSRTSQPYIVRLVNRCKKIGSLPPHPVMSPLFGYKKEKDSPQDPGYNFIFVLI